MNKHITLKINRFESPLFGIIRTLVETVDVQAHNKAIEREIREIQKRIMYDVDCELVSKAMNRLITLKKQMLRTGEGRQEWFVVKDVCRALGYKSHCGALRTHVRSEDVTNREIRDANNHRPKMLVVNERGLDALILGGRLHAAPFFKGYITGVMLPSIRGLKPWFPWPCAGTVCAGSVPGPFGVNHELPD